MALQKKKVSELPVKLKKITIKKCYYNYLVILSEDNKTILQQRTKKGIWQQLYEFPLVESSKEIGINQLQQMEEYKELYKKHSISSVVLYNEKSIIHKLSHRHLYTRFWVVETLKNSIKGVSVQTINKYPVPALIEKFIASFFKL